MSFSTRTLRNGEPEEADMSRRQIELVRRLAGSWAAEGQAPTLVVLVARRGVIVLHEAFGHLGPEPDAPLLTRDAIFPLASISKTITATAVMCLVEDGLLGLNRPVQEYIPEFADEGKEQVMVHHLLTHTSGMNDESLNGCLLKKKDAGELVEPDEPDHPFNFALPFLRYFRAAVAAPLWKPPGEEMSYCSFGYSLLGEIVERVTERSLGAFARDRIFAQLGMRDTCYGFPHSATDRFVRRAPDARGMHHFERPGWPPRCLAMGGACSTALDVAVFAQTFLNKGSYGEGRVLSPALIAEMTRNQIPGIGSRTGDSVNGGEYFPEAGWGLSWGIKENKKALRHGTLDSPDTFSHGGAGGVHLSIDPRHELIVVYFSVVLQYYPSGMEKWNADLFVNAVTAAVVDV